MATQTLKIGDKTYNLQEGETEKQLFARGRSGVADTEYKRQFSSKERAQGIRAAEEAAGKTMVKDPVSGGYTEVLTGQGGLTRDQRKAVSASFGGQVQQDTPEQLAKKYGFPEGAGVEMQEVNGKWLPVMTSFNGKPLPLGAPGNLANKQPQQNTQPVSQSERERYEEQIGQLQQGMNAYKDTAEELKLSTLKRMKEQEQSLNKSFTDLKKLLGDRFQLVQDEIAKAEAKTGKEVAIDQDFVNRMVQFSGIKENDEEFRNAVSHVAFGSTVDPARDRLSAFYATPEGQEFQNQYGNVGAASGAQAGAAGAGGVAGPAAAAGMQVTPVSTDPIINFNPSKATGTTAGLLSNPNATSEEILISLFQSETASIDQNTTRVLKFLENSAANTRMFQDKYSNMLQDQRSEITGVVQEQIDFLNKKYSLIEDEIKAEKATTVQDLNRKRSRLEGYLKAKLKAEGVLDGSFGVNSYLSKITQYDAMIQNTKNQFDLKIRQADLDRTESVLGLTTELVKINAEFAQKEFDFFFNAEKSVEDTLFKSLQTVNEAQIEKSKLFSSTTKDILKIRQEREEAMAKAVKEAEERLQKKSETLTEALGIVHTVENGQIVMMTDSNGDPILSWDRTKGSAELELKGEELKLDQEKNLFDQWYKESSLAIDRAVANSNISKTQAEVWKMNLEQGREMQEFLWKQQDREEQKGYLPTGQIETAIINGREFALDSGALQSAQKLNSILTPFGGLRIGGESTSTTRDQAETIKSMAQRLGIPFDAGNPNATAAKLRAAGHAVADVGHSNHEKGVAMDLFPDHAYINQVKPYLLANGWVQPYPKGDAGHFEFVGGKSANIASWEKVQISEFLGKKFSGRVTSPGTEQIAKFQNELESQWSLYKAGGGDLDSFLSGKALQNWSIDPNDLAGSLRRIQEQFSQSLSVSGSSSNAATDDEEEEDDGSEIKF